MSVSPYRVEDRCPGYKSTRHSTLRHGAFCTVPKAGHKREKKRPNYPPQELFVEKDFGDLGYIGGERVYLGPRFLGVGRAKACHPLSPMGALTCVINFNQIIYKFYLAPSYVVK